jgi:hypothetical protein
MKPKDLTDLISTIETQQGQIMKEMGLSHDSEVLQIDDREVDFEQADIDEDYDQNQII